MSHVNVPSYQGEYWLNDRGIVVPFVGHFFHMDGELRLPVSNTFNIGQLLLLSDGSRYLTAFPDKIVVARGGFSAALSIYLSDSAAGRWI